MKFIKGTAAVFGGNVTLACTNLAWNALAALMGVVLSLVGLAFVSDCAVAAPAHRLELGANVNESLTQLDPGLLSHSHTTWVRGFLPASQFLSGRRNLATDPGVHALEQCASNGCKVIVSLKWDLREAQWRVPAPGSETETKWFAWVDELLNQMHGQISMLSLVNEVFIDTEPEDLKPDIAGRVPMVIFLRRLAGHVAAQQLKSADGHLLPLYCGGFTRLDTTAMQTNAIALELMEWCATDSQIAGVDFHLHQRDYEQFTQALDFIRRRVPAKPLIVTEYSFIWQYKKHLNDSLGDAKPGHDFCERYKIAPTLSVLDYINGCIGQPVPEAEWNAFLRSQSWLDPNFLKRTSDMMEEHGVIVATYAFSQKSSGGTKLLDGGTTPWLLNPIFVPSTAFGAVPGNTPVNTVWFNDYLLHQQNASALTKTPTKRVLTNTDPVISESRLTAFNPPL